MKVLHSRYLRQALQERSQTSWTAQFFIVITERSTPGLISENSNGKMTVFCLTFKKFFINNSYVSYYCLFRSETAVAQPVSDTFWQRAEHIAKGWKTPNTLNKIPISFNSMIKLIMEVAEIHIRLITKKKSHRSGKQILYRGKFDSNMYYKWTKE